MRDALHAVPDCCCLQWLKESNFVSLLLDTFDTDNDMVRSRAPHALAHSRRREMWEEGNG